MDKFLEQVKAAGFAGVQNFPTVGLIDGNFRANLEETNMGYNKEVEVIRMASELDLLTTPYVFDKEDAVKMTEAGADILVAHMGLTTSGSIGAKTARKLEDCVGPIDEIVKTAKAIREDIVILCHGGPIAMPDDAQYIIDNVEGIDGFYGASSMERLPTEKAIKEQAEKFTQIRRKK
jgi:predicted TIM-barrel enzyme